MSFTLLLRVPNGGVITYSEKHHRPVAEKYAAEIYDRKHAPLGLVGDNAADQLLAVLVDRAKRQLDQLERSANHRIHALWLLTYRGRRLLLDTPAFKYHVEKTVEMFKEGKNRIYDKLAWEHGRKPVSKVFGILKASERLPRDYIKLVAEWGGILQQALAYEMTKMVVDQEDWSMVSRNGAVPKSRGSVDAGDGKGKGKGKSACGTLVDRDKGKASAWTLVDRGEGHNRKMRIERWQEEEGECSYRPRRRVSSDDDFDVESDIDQDSDDSFEGAVVVSMRERWHE